jgi:hypothetical protein
VSIRSKPSPAQVRGVVSTTNVLVSSSKPYACAHTHPAPVGTNGKVKESNTRLVPSHMYLLRPCTTVVPKPSPPRARRVLFTPSQATTRSTGPTAAGSGTSRE